MNDVKYNKAGFEIESCGRCGGSGQYSFNPMDGTRCFGCGGSGYKLTKRGRVAKARFHELLQKKASEVKVGDYLYDFIGLGAGRCWQKVVGNRIDELNKGMIIMELSRKGKSVGSLGLWPGTMVMSVECEEDRQEYLAEALAYQASLTKLGKPRKSKEEVK
jgi:hypothetical protein